MRLRRGIVGQQRFFRASSLNTAIVSVAAGHVATARATTAARAAQQGGGKGEREAPTGHYIF